jgi:hypothetical protein
MNECNGSLVSYINCRESRHRRLELSADIHYVVGEGLALGSTYFDLGEAAELNNRLGKRKGKGKGKGEGKGKGKEKRKGKKKSKVGRLILSATDKHSKGG